MTTMEIFGAAIVAAACLCIILVVDRIRSRRNAAAALRRAMIASVGADRGQPPILD
jgi:hypothetical protein